MSGWGLARPAAMTPKSKASVWDAIASTPTARKKAATDADGGDPSPLRQWSHALQHSPGAIDRHYADDNRARRLKELRSIRVAASEAVVARTRSGNSAPAASPPPPSSSSPPVPTPASPDDLNLNLAPASPLCTPSPLLQQTTSYGPSPQQSARVEQLETSLRQEVASRAAMADAQGAALAQLETARTDCAALQASLREVRDGAATRAAELSTLEARVVQLEAATQASEARSEVAEAKIAAAISDRERFELRSQQLAEQLQEHAASAPASPELEQRCVMLESELTSLRAEMEHRVAGEREKSAEVRERSEQAMEKSVVTVTQAEAKLCQKALGLSLSQKEVAYLRARVKQQAPPNNHFALWNATRRHEEEQCLVRKLQQALQTSELRRTASEAEADTASAAVDRDVPPPPASPSEPELQPEPEPAVQVSAVRNIPQVAPPDPEPEPELQPELDGSPVLLAELLAIDFTAATGAPPSAARRVLHMEPAAGAEEFFSERRTEAGPGAEQELAAAVEECAEETQREEEARGVEELLGAAAELQHVVAAEREQRRIEQCQLVAALGASMNRYDSYAITGPTPNQMAAAMAAATALSPQRASYQATDEFAEQRWQQQPQWQPPPLTTSPPAFLGPPAPEPGQMPTSLPPPSRGMATRRLKEEADILRRMARLGSPGLADTTSAEQSQPVNVAGVKRTRSDISASPQQAPQAQQVAPRTPERRHAVTAIEAPLSPALAAARKLLHDMGEPYIKPPAPPGSPGDLPQSLSGYTDHDELGSSLERYELDDEEAFVGKGVPALVAVPVNDSPQRELETIRKQIKSMQTARKTRASVLHGFGSVVPATHAVGE